MVNENDFLLIDSSHFFEILKSGKMMNIISQNFKHSILKNSFLFLLYTEKNNNTKKSEIYAIKNKASCRSQ